MLNIFALDRVSSPPDKNVLPNVPQLCRETEMWEGTLAESSAALEAEKKKNEEARKLNE